MKKRFSIFLVLLLLLVACNNAAQQQTSVVENVEGEKTLQLNNGERWVVNAAMKPFIEKSMQLVAAYQRNPTTGNYQALAAEIEAQNKLLVNSCTMKGAAHDALHLWLYPHLRLVRLLKSATSQEEANTVVTQLQISFDTYKRFFQ